MIRLMLVVSMFYWGHGEKPKCGQPSAAFGVVESRYVAIADTGSCRITMARVRLSRPQRCAVMIHEMGHLYGHDHSPDPRDVMFFALEDSSIPLWCRRAFR